MLLSFRVFNCYMGRVRGFFLRFFCRLSRVVYVEYLVRVLEYIKGFIKDRGCYFFLGEVGKIRFDI